MIHRKPDSKNPVPPKMPAHTSSDKIGRDGLVKPPKIDIVRVGVAVVVWGTGTQKAVLLGKRKGDHEGGTYSLPGGHVEMGEHPIQTAARELWEETGLVPISLMPYYKKQWVSTVFDSGKQYITLFFQATVDGKPTVKEPDKCESWNWYPTHSLPKPLFGALHEEMFR